MRILLVNAFDSFSHIIFQYLSALSHEVEVVRSHTLSPQRVRAHPADLVVLGPGPGHPLDSGHVELVRHLSGVKPLFGVCLGLQAVAAAHGAHVRPAAYVMHGKTSRVDHDGRGCFTGLDQGFAATRYHSLVVDEATLPAHVRVSARSQDDGYVMGLRVEGARVEAVQFHPESVLTERGLAMFANVADAAACGGHTPVPSHVPTPKGVR